MSTFKPDWTYENQYNGPVCGVDEAGRGPLAGPVIAFAVILLPNHVPKGLNDSKALSQARREYLVNELETLAKFNLAFIGIGASEPEEIDRINILQASLTAMGRAVAALPRPPIAALIDGNKAPKLNCPSQTIVKGDAKSLSIAAASILAKEHRDALMKAADERYPGYGFARHKGYPTAHHKAQLSALGPSALHRRSFKPVSDFYSPPPTGR